MKLLINESVRCFIIDSDMIQFADDSTKQAVRDMWKRCFGDSDDYMDIYFQYKYRNENTLIYISDGKPVASLQMLIYSFTFHGKEIPVVYHSGLCTLPEYRGRGYMKDLIVRSYQVALERGIPLIVLVPQDEGVMSYYHKFGFAQTFESGVEVLPSLLKIIEKSNGDMLRAYELFDNLYRDSDMTVQKTFEDFIAIAEEAKLFDYPNKKNLTGMARVVDVSQLFSLFVEAPNILNDKTFIFKIEDEHIERNNGVYKVSEGKVEKIKSIDASLKKNVIELNIREITQLLLGYHTSEENDQLRSIFPKKSPSMHFMLE